MKRIVFSMVTAVLAVFLVSCTSSQPVSTATPSTHSFEGFWELPDGEIFLFEKKAFVLLDPDGKRALNGIARNQTNTQLTLNYYYNYQLMRADIVYSVLSGNEVKVSKPDMLAGVWKRRNDLNNETANKLSAIPFLGYWEDKGEEDMAVMHITPWGWGFMYFTDLSYLLEGAGGGDISYGSISYDLKSPMNGIKITFIEGDSKSQSITTRNARPVIDGNDLLLGNGDDLSEYLRYKRVK